jgi:hypothetical protein
LRSRRRALKKWAPPIIAAHFRFGDRYAPLHLVSDAGLDPQELCAVEQPELMVT